MFSVVKRGHEAKHKFLEKLRGYTLKSSLHIGGRTWVRTGVKMSSSNENWKVFNKNWSLTNRNPF